MSHPIGTYSFLPWLRRGIANRIGTAPASGPRPTVSVTVRAVGEGGEAGARGEDVDRPVALYGPGDVVGVDPRAIVRVEPRDWITNFEPNYLPFVEFYDEDFPWRYTPVAPDSQSRLSPWLALVVLEEGEFGDAGTLPAAKLPAVTIEDTTLLPDAAELWAWAHVHVNRDLAGGDDEIVSTDMGAVIPRLEAALTQNADVGSSRVICPRRLKENTPYHAFLMPAFETGRLAGLGVDPAATPGLAHSAWGPGRTEQPTSFCFYHRWYFRTGTVGDFEYLVRLLEPRRVSARVGQRDMDVLTPGSDLPPIANPHLGGVLRLGGALRVPAVNLNATETTEAARYENWDEPYPDSFQRALADLVNLPEDLAAGDVADPDPVVTPPMYGRWHAQTERLLDPLPPPPATNDNWVHELNLDPRFRAAAGFGTSVVQKQQEDLMASAWEQAGAILEANRRIRLGQVALGVATRWHVRHLEPHLTATPGHALALTAPLHARVVTDGVTIAHQLRGSVVGAAPLSPPMRRIMRPGGRLVRALDFPAGSPASELPALIAAGEVTAAPPKEAPPALVTLPEVVEELRRDGVPDAVLDALDSRPWLRHLLLLLAIVLLIVALSIGGIVGLGVGLVVAALLVWLWLLLGRWAAADEAAQSIGEGNLTPEAVDALPTSPDFELTEVGSPAVPSHGATDSAEAQRFKLALKDANATFAGSVAAAARPPRTAVDVPVLAAGALALLHPSLTIPHRVLSGIQIPPRWRPPVAEHFREAMAYPVIDTPMYRPLVDISAELFLPNLNLIEQNTITLLETNQRFIEAYMVGLNHEFARELVWREFPTDRRGSTLRQFWDVRSQPARPGESEEERRERLRDIPPLHRWSVASQLGEHDHREENPDAPEEEVVLVIRGELLKKYPTAVVYAQRAEWVREPDGTIDPDAERRLVALTAADEEDPPRDKLRMPLYGANVEPDVHFLGFDLTAAAARGGSGEDPDDDPGWFFVIRERPGDPRFGFDIERDGPLNVWNDLAWSDVLPAGSEFVPAGAAAPSFTLADPAPPPDPDSSPLIEKKEQYEEDRHVGWGGAMNSSDVAYVAYQAPVLVAVHAQEMLRDA